MPWVITDRVEDYAERAWPLLASRAAEQTLALTVLDSVRNGHRFSAAPMTFGWYERDGEVLGAVSMTPPFELLLAVVPDGTVPELAGALRAAGAEPPGVHGDTAPAEAFAAAWTAGTPLRPVVALELLLQRLGELVPPAPPPGRARRAGAADFDLAVDWFRAFNAHADTPAGDPEPAVRERLGGDRLWLWEDETGAPASMAACTATVAGVARIAPVYTPPEHRRRGYAEAVTAVCTQDALDRGAAEVVLFTDRNDPTPNAIYGRLGFRPVADRVMIRFTPRAHTA